MDNASSETTTFGLNPPEKRLVKATWTVIRKDMGKNALIVFLNFFREYPHNLKYFPFTRPMDVVDIEDMEAEPLLRLHAMRVFRDLSKCIDNLDKPEALLHILRANALNHRKRDIEKMAYDELRNAILGSLDQMLTRSDKKCPHEVILAWDKTLRTIFQVITDFNEAKTCGCVQGSANEP